MKIKISFWWIIFVPLVYLSHTYKILLFIFTLLSIHELMHIICAKHFHYQTTKICIYPFGLNAHIKDFEYKKSIYEILITLAGLSVHIFMYIILIILYHADLISYNFMDYLNSINLTILLFNCIPIYPLDGGRILRNILEFIFPYKKARQLSLLFSFFFLLFLAYYKFFYGFSGMFLFVFFFIQLLICCFTFKKNLYDFYLYRFLHLFDGKVKVHDKQDIYKNRLNYIIENDRLKKESEYLEKYF